MPSHIASIKARSILSSLGVPQWAAILFVWCLCVRLAFSVLVVSPDAGLEGDELDYNSYAVNLVTQNRYIHGDGGPYWPADLSRRPPAFPLYVALVYQVFGLDNHLAVRVAQSVIGALLCVVLYLLALQSFDARVALGAGLIASIYPYLVYYCGQLRPEPLYSLLVYSGALFYLQFLGTARMASGALAGILWGLAVLTHSDWLLTMPCFFIWGLFALRKQAWLKLASTFALVAAVVLPWTFRNYLVHRAFVPVSTNLGVTIAGANNPAIVRDPVLRGQWLPPQDMLQFVGDLSGRSEIERDRIQTQYALSFIRQNPRDFLVLGFWRLVHHWHLYYPLTHQSPVELAGLAFYFVILAVGLVSMFRLSTSRHKPALTYFALTLFAFTNIIAFAIRGGPRYRLLFDPCLLILASSMVVSVGKVLPSRQPPGQGILDKTG